MIDRKLPPMPRFETEAEEAQWWFDHRFEVEQDLLAAMERGDYGEGSVARGARKLKEAEAAEAVAADSLSRRG